MSSLLIEGGRADLRQDRGRGQQERRAAAAGRVPADDRGMRAHEHASHRRRRGHGEAAEGNRRRSPRPRHHDASACGARSITTSEPSSELVGKLRGSVLLLGPLLARTGRAVLATPGGDFPARRTIGTHIDALVQSRCDACCRRAAMRWRRPNGLHAGVDVSGRSVGDRHRDRAAGGRDDRGRHRNPPCRNRAARRRSVQVPAEHGRRHHRRGIVDDPRRRHDDGRGAPPTS